MKFTSVPTKTFRLVQTHLGAESKFKARYKALRLSLASLFSAGALGRWYTFLEIPEYSAFAATNKDLPIKPIRSYLSRRFNIQQRIEILEATYRLASLRGGVLSDVLLQNSEIVLASIPLPDAHDDVEIVLSRPGVYREGEFLVSLRFEGRSLVAKASFSFSLLADTSYALYIGCFQGGKNTDDVRAMEKAMHGLRPKAAVLFALQEIGAVLGATALFGIGNHIQIKTGRLEERLRKRENLQFDYDGFWQESEGEKQPDGWFNLPLRLVRRSWEEMKPNKRASYRRRYAMLDEISVQIQKALG